MVDNRFHCYQSLECPTHRIDNIIHCYHPQKESILFLPLSSIIKQICIYTCPVDYQYQRMFLTSQESWVGENEIYLIVCNRTPWSAEPPNPLTRSHKYCKVHIYEFYRRSQASDTNILLKH